MIVKYKIPIADKIAVEPFLGGYLACGVGGKIKDFNNREAYNSFNSKNANAAFNRFDGEFVLDVALVTMSCMWRLVMI